MSGLDSLLFCMAVVSSFLTIMKFCTAPEGIRWGRFIVCLLMVLILLFLVHYPWFRISIVVAEMIGVIINSASSQTGRFHAGRLMAIVASITALMILITLGPTIFSDIQQKGLVWNLPNIQLSDQAWELIMPIVILLPLDLLISFCIMIIEKNTPFSEIKSILLMILYAIINCAWSFVVLYLSYSASNLSLLPLTMQTEAIVGLILSCIIYLKVVNSEPKGK